MASPRQRWEFIVTDQCCVCNAGDDDKVTMLKDNYQTFQAMSLWAVLAMVWSWTATPLLVLWLWLGNALHHTHTHSLEPH